MKFLTYVSDWFVARIKEPTTWLGIGTLVAAVSSGHTDPGTVITGVLGAFGVVLKEKAS